MKNNYLTWGGVNLKEIMDEDDFRLVSKNYPTWSGVNNKFISYLGRKL